MLNGYAATKDDWDPDLLDRLAGFTELTCLDGPGVGDSILGEGELTIGSAASQVGAALGELGIERAPILGWSMGGFVAQQLAADHPEQVDSLVLLSTAGGGPDAARAAPADWQRLIDHGGSPPEQASRLLSLLFPPALVPGIDARFGELVAAARAQLPQGGAERPGGRDGALVRSAP